MEPPSRPLSSSSSTSLFQVYLRLRPHASTGIAGPSLYPSLPSPERFLTVEPAEAAEQCNGNPTHITIHPPSDSRKRAVEKFGFTRVFEEQTSQLEIFNDTGAVSLVEGVLDEGRDGLLATLGVTGSGKTHTILGSKSQRGLTQLSLDLVFRSLQGNCLHPNQHSSLVSSLMVADASEAHIQSASGFLDGVYGDNVSSSRAATPMTVGIQNSSSANKYAFREGIWSQWSLLGLLTRTPEPENGSDEDQETGLVEGDVAVKKIYEPENRLPSDSARALISSSLAYWRSPRISRTKAKLRFGNILQDTSFTPSTRRHILQRPSALPRLPDISQTYVSSSKHMDYAILVCMYEVYNDRVFDLLCHPRNSKDLRRRPLLFKSTEGSPDRKVVAGLKKVVCGTYEEAMMVLETALMERRVAGTGSNSVSSRSHGFFCIEVKKRPKSGMASAWTGSTLTVVDLAGSERARNAKTAGATLAEAGKINESLMYLGQCLQMQSDYGENSRTIVPFRQCKLTELLFSNSFPHANNPNPSHHRNPQKAVMIVTADPLGDFNATSQILRYSALAREVTVPRIPSVASIVFKDGMLPTVSKSGRTSPDQNAIYELEEKVRELNDQVEILALRLADETCRRKEAEEAWQTATVQLETLEGEVREDCFEEMEQKIESERRRWMEALGDEADRNEAHLDAKLEILSRGIKVHEDGTATGSKSPNVQELESENANLRAQVARLEREMQTRSPTKSRSSKAKTSPRAKKLSQPPKLGSLNMDINDDPFTVGKENQGVDVLQKLEILAIDGPEGSAAIIAKTLKSPTRSPRKMRTLTPHRGIAPGAVDDGADSLMGTP